MSEDQGKAVRKVHKILDDLNTVIHKGGSITGNSGILDAMEILTVAFQSEILDGKVDEVISNEEVIRLCNEFTKKYCNVLVMYAGCDNEYYEHSPSANGTIMGNKWTVEDANCREHVREVLNLITDKTTDGDRFCYQSPRHDRVTHQAFYGKDIEEAEIKCIDGIRLRVLEREGKG